MIHRENVENFMDNNLIYQYICFLILLVHCVRNISDKQEETQGLDFHAFFSNVMETNNTDPKYCNKCYFLISNLI